MDKLHHNSPCPLEGPLSVFTGKWKPALLFYLLDQGSLRHSELLRQLDSASQKVITQQLRELERDGVVQRMQRASKTPHVEYKVTDLGKTIRPIFEMIHRWNDEHMAEVRAKRLSAER